MTTFVTVEKDSGKLAEYHPQTATSLGYVECEDGVWRREPRRPAWWGRMAPAELPSGRGEIHGWNSIIGHHEYNLPTLDSPAGETPTTGEQEEDPDATAEGNTQQED